MQWDLGEISSQRNADVSHSHSGQPWAKVSGKHHGRFRHGGCVDVEGSVDDLCKHWLDVVLAFK